MVHILIILQIPKHHLIVLNCSLITPYLHFQFPRISSRFNLNALIPQDLIWFDYFRFNIHLKVSCFNFFIYYDVNIKFKNILFNFYKVIILKLNIIYNFYNVLILKLVSYLLIFLHIIINTIIIKCWC